MERLGLTTERMRRGARTYKKVHTNWPQGPERSFAARRLHSTAMYLGTATATATVQSLPVAYLPPRRIHMSVFPPAPSAPSAPSTVCLSLSLWWRPEVVGRAGVGRYLGSRVKSITSPHLTSSPPHLTPPRPNSPAGYSQLHPVLHPGRELLAFFRSHSRSRSTKHPSPHVKSPPLAALSALRLHVFVRTPTGKQSVRRAVVAYHLAHNPTPVVFSSRSDPQHMLSHARQTSPCSSTQQRNQVSDTKARILSCNRPPRPMDSCAMTR
jgi:hypothetical protein